VRLEGSTEAALQRWSISNAHSLVYLHKSILDIVQKKGIEQVTVEQLIAEITPTARSTTFSHHRFFLFIAAMKTYIFYKGTVPDSVRTELLSRIRKILSEGGGDS
jgi:hypothetical protein